jgi:hypothetical protein
VSYEEMRDRNAARWWLNRFIELSDKLKTLHGTETAWPLFQLIDLRDEFMDLAQKSKEALTK